MMKFFKTLHFNPALFTEALSGLWTRMAAAWPFSWHSISAMVLGVFLAHWFWIIFAPHTPQIHTPSDTAFTANAGNLFGIAVQAGETRQGGELPNVKLLGVFTASLGRSGFAVLKMDDRKQTGVAEGEEVISGTRLKSVHADHVMLERNGVQYKVELEKKYTPQPGQTQLIPAGPAAANAQVENALATTELQSRIQKLKR